MSQSQHHDDGPADPFRRPPDRLIDVGNGSVAVRTLGNGPDAMFVHGWPASGATFRNLLPELAPHLRCHVLDLVGAGDSVFDRSVQIDLAHHAEAVRRVVDALGLDDVAVVGHDSGGLIARLALAGDPRVRAWGLIDTEQPQGANWRFRSFLLMRHIPRFERMLASIVNMPRVRRNRFLLGDCFDDRSLLDGEFAELYLRPLLDDADRRWASGRFARGFDLGAFASIAALHARITVPVQLVWGALDPFFPLAWTREMLAGFGGETHLHVVERGKLFVHEEFAEETASALLDVLRSSRAPDR